MDAHTKRHLRRARKLFKTDTEFGRAIGRSQQYVSFLLNQAKKVPAEVALDIDRATAGIVSKSQLRPELWPVALSEAGAGPEPEASDQAA